MYDAAQIHHFQRPIGEPDGTGFGYFIYNYVTENNDCLDTAKPDLGGTGNVPFAVVQTLLTTTALIVVTCLDRYLSEGWTHASTTFISVSGDTAAFLGISLLLSAYIDVAADQHSSILHFNDACLSLVVYIYAALSSVHMAALLVLRKRSKRHRKTTALRITLLLCYSGLLGVTVVLSRYCYENVYVIMEVVLVKQMGMFVQFEMILEYILPAAPMLYVIWLSVYQYIRPDEKRTAPLPERWRRIMGFLLYSNRKTVTGFQIVFAIGSTVFIMLQKFTVAPDPTPEDRVKGVGQWCSLNNKVDNSWTFSQACSMLLLLIPLYASVESLFRKFHP